MGTIRIYNAHFLFGEAPCHAVNSDDLSYSWGGHVLRLVQLRCRQVQFRSDFHCDILCQHHHFNAQPVITSRFTLKKRQRQEFRLSGGKLKIWGKEPLFVEAKYTTKDGEERTSLLLASGWWGVARYVYLIVR